MGCIDSRENNYKEKGENKLMKSSQQMIFESQRLQNGNAKPEDPNPHQKFEQQIIQQRNKNQLLLRQIEQLKILYAENKQELKQKIEECQMWKNQVQKCFQQKKYLRDKLIKHLSLFPRAAQLLDNQCTSFQRVQIVGNAIIAKGTAFLFGRQIIRTTYSFTLYVQRLKQTMGFGIIDDSYRKFDKLTTAITPNGIVYYSNSKFWDGSKMMTKNRGSFGMDDKIYLSVNVLQSQISVSINDKQVKRQKYSIFNRLKDTKWVAYIYLTEQGDTVILKV